MEGPRATTDKNDPFLNSVFKHGKKWVGQNAIWDSGVQLKIPGGTLRTRDCGQGRNVLNGRGRTTGTTNPLTDPSRGGTLGRRVNSGPFHPTVVQWFKVRRTTSVVNTKRKNGMRKWHVVRNTERIER